MKTLAVFVALLLSTLSTPAAAQTAQTLEGRWKMIAAEDVRADGTVGRLPWGKNVVGQIIIQDGWLYLQIMSGDVASFPAGKGPVGEQMKAAVLNTYVSYTGAISSINEAEGVVTFKVAAGSQPGNVGTEQKRPFRLADGKLFFGPGAKIPVVKPDTTREIPVGNNPADRTGETLTRRLTLVRAGN